MRDADPEALEAGLASYRDRSNREIRALLDEHEDREASDYPSRGTLAANRAVMAAGKRYRYAVACLTYQALTGRTEFELPARPAVWLELYHMYTLFLDDIMDEDERRRTVPSGWSTDGKLYRRRDASRPARAFRTRRHRYGVSMAILDALRLRSLAERAIHRADRVDSNVRGQLLALLTDTDLTLSDGQGLDIDFEGRDRLPEEDYVRMSEMKTGVLYVAAARTGALLAAASQERTRAVEGFARRFATAFQDRDDLLGAGVVPSDIGGSRRGDIEHGKRTRLFTIATARMPAAKRKAFLAAYGKGSKTTENDVRLVRSLVRAYAVDAMTDRIGENVEGAVAALESARAAEPYRSTLEALARVQLVRRK